MIDDVFANRVFEKFDILDNRIGDLCTRMTTIETIHTQNEKKLVENKKDKKDRRNWYLGIVTFVFGAYIAIKELM